MMEQFKNVKEDLSNVTGCYFCSYFLTKFITGPGKVVFKSDICVKVKKLIGITNATGLTLS